MDRCKEPNLKHVHDDGVDDDDDDDAEVKRLI